MQKMDAKMKYFINLLKSFKIKFRHQSKFVSKLNKKIMILLVIDQSNKKK